MIRRFIALILLLILVEIARPQGLPVDAIKNLKAATVLLKASLPGDPETSGTGFIVHADAKGVLIATSRFVVCPPPELAPVNVRVIFEPGLKGERSLRGEVVAYEADYNLALVRVLAPNLPAPVRFPARLALAETAPVFHLGFPLAIKPEPGKQNAGVVISKGTISSLRENEEGQLEAIQINGDIGPGTFGGPVVDGQGQLVGLALGRVRGSGLGLAIPSVEVRRLVEGRLGEMKVKTLKAADGQAEVQLEFKVFDPLQKIKQASIVVAPSESLKDALIRAEDGSYPMLPGGKGYDLKLEGGLARGTITIPTGGKTSQKFTFQPAFVNADKKTIHLAPALPHLVDFARAAVVTIPKGFEGTRTRSVGEPQVTSKQFGEGATPPCLFWAADGKSFYHLDGAGTVRRVSYPSLEVEATNATGKGCSWLSPSALGLLLSVTSMGEVWILDAKSLVVVKKCPANGLHRAVSAPGLQHAFAAANEVGIGGVLRVLDLVQGKEVKMYAPKELQATVPEIGFGWPVVTPDGRFLLGMGPNGTSLCRFRIEGEKLFPEEASYGIAQGQINSICVSADGKYVCVPSGQGNSKLPDDDRGVSHATHLFLTTAYRKQVMTLIHQGQPGAVAFDVASGLLYGQNSESHLIVFDLDGKAIKHVSLAKTPAGANVRQILVHPDGRKVLVLHETGPVIMRTSTLYAVNIPPG